MTTVFQPGNTAVITGGASGIGLALAKRCAAAGMRVLVADRDAAALTAAPAAACAGADNDTSDVLTVEMDVSSPEGWAVLRRRVDDEFGGRVSLLALNAGVGGAPSRWDSAESFRRVLDVNLGGVVNGLAACLDAVRAAAGGGKAAVVITGSKQGITCPPGNPAYNASKAAVKALAEHLDYDLRAEDNVGVHLLVPGWTFTGMTGGGGAREKPAGAWWPEQVVEFLERRMAEGKFYAVCPDNDVSESTDRRRMLWSVGDIVEGRPPMSRWREEWKGPAQEWMDKQSL
ncbi:uncharacterized protein E0L32_008460 [Thyridium curvatum]|uniref:Uncharacterized protein n=1 Tax=Thyridium curvatum TaxID=1093900 RepID=A0A507AVR3_9PEZI|nr:uncharacterized protein E0L32_008460 [Thyridium curvatum]TPX10574.1 hypothetical protein E0L32_008460 [Thyridium curvatum]